MQIYRATKNSLLILITGLIMTTIPLAAFGNTPARKAGRGLAAMALPFLHLTRNIQRTTESDGARAGWPVGFAQGLGMSLIRPAVGFYELISAPFPSPPGYEPLLQPEYPWGYWVDVEK